MSYEREAIATPPVPSTAPLPMREDKVVNTYSTALKPKAADIGQTITNGQGIQPGTEESVQLSPKLAALAREEQRFRQKEAALKAREKAAEEKLAKVAKLEAMEAKLAAKDYSGLEEAGVSYDEYTQYLLNKTNGTTPEQQALKKLADEMEQLKKSQTEDVTKRFEAAVNERRLAVKALVETDPEFMGISELKAQEHVIQHILDTWEQDDIDLEPKQAALEVEKVIRERAAKGAALHAKLTGGTVGTPEKKQLPELKPGLKTLTNQMIANGATRPVKNLQDLPEAERYAEARRRSLERLQKQG